MFDRFALANIPASEAALGDLLKSVEGECPGVLTGAPSEQAILSKPGSGGAVAQSEQLAAIDGQYVISALLTWLLPDRSAGLALAAKLGRLHWSSARLTRLVHAVGTELRLQFAPSPPNLCGEAREWVASGYTKMPAAVARYVAELRSRPQTGEARGAVDALLARKETAGERALLHTEAQLRARLSRAATIIVRSAALLHAAIGLRAPEPLSPEDIKGTIIGSGRTAAGGTFTASAQPVKKNCSPDIAVTEVAPEEAWSDGGFSCLPAALQHVIPPVSCEEGLLRIKTELSPAAVTARLLLSDGSHIDSPVMLVPANLGGPQGFYYQAVRGPSPIPVSITELNAAGATIAVLKLAPVVECTKHPRKLLPGGRRTLGRGRLADGSPFAIVGERFSYLGKVQFVVLLKVGSSSDSGPLPSAGTLSWAVVSRCSRHPYVIAIGLLRSPADTVLARTAKGLVVLRKTVIPASLHQTGDLVYASVSLPPREFIVRDARGRTVRRSSTGRIRREEVCTPSARGNEESSGSTVGHTR